MDPSPERCSRSRAWSRGPTESSRSERAFLRPAPEVLAAVLRGSRSQTGGGGGPQRERVVVRYEPGEEVSKDRAAKGIVDGGGVGRDANPPSPATVETGQGSNPGRGLEVRGTLDATTAHAYWEDALQTLGRGEGDSGQVHEGGED